MKQEQKENLYSCNICKDTSWIISKDGKATRCKCFELDTIKEQWKSSGFKIDDMDKTFKNFIHWNNEVKNMKSTATNYFLNFEKKLCFFGVFLLPIASSNRFSSSFCFELRDLGTSTVTVT